MTTPNPSSPDQKTAAVVSGYFSPLHVGHLDMIEGATELADEVFVIVNNNAQQEIKKGKVIICLLYTSPSPRDQRGSRMPSSA